MKTTVKKHIRTSKNGRRFSVKRHVRGRVKIKDNLIIREKEDKKDNSIKVELWNEKVIVAELTVYYNKERKEWSLWNLRSYEKGKGHATILIKYVIERFNKTKYKQLDLYAYKRLKPFYENLGFVVAEKKKSYYIMVYEKNTQRNARRGRPKQLKAILSNDTLKGILPHRGQKRVFVNKSREDGGGSLIGFSDEDELMQNRYLIPHNAHIRSIKIDELDPDKPSLTLVNITTKTGKNEVIMLEDSYKTNLQGSVAEAVKRAKFNSKLKKDILNKPFQYIKNNYVRDQLRALAEDMGLENPRGDFNPLYNRIKQTLLEHRTERQVEFIIPDVEL